LLQMGADMYIKDALGRTAEDIAKNAFSRKAYDVLKNHERVLEMKKYDPKTLNASSSGSEKDNSDFEEVSSAADVQSLTSCEVTVSREDEESSQCPTLALIFNLLPWQRTHALLSW
jgi:PAB1-binding protein PBP1